MNGFARGMKYLFLFIIVYSSSFFLTSIASETQHTPPPPANRPICKAPITQLDRVAVFETVG